MTSTRPTLDRDLAAAAAEGDRRAIEQLVIEIAPVVTAMANRRCRRRVDAEDLAAVALETALRPAVLRRYDGRGSLRGYLTVVAQRSIIAVVRTRSFQRHNEALQGISFDERLTAPAAEQVAIAGKLSGRLEHAMNQLPARAELIVRLRADGFSEAEVAEVLGLPLGTVKSTFSRARAQLRATLTPNSGGDDVRSLR